jgi:hypothetical protein
MNDPEKAREEAKPEVAVSSKTGRPLKCRVCAASALVLKTILEAIEAGAEWTCEEVQGVNSYLAPDRKTGEIHSRREMQGTRMVIIRIPPIVKENP